jgi:adenylate cyclase
MDVTITTTGTNMNVDIPDENDLRRIRTSSSVVNGMSYGIADTLGKNNHLNMLDLVHEFRGIKKDAIFALFGRAHPPNQSQTAITSNRLARYLKDNFIRVFIAQLSALDPQRPESVPDALRRSFLKLNQDLHRILFDPPRTTPAANLGNTPPIADPSIVHSGASGVVVYISDKKMYVANVGNALAVISRGGTAHSVSTKHEPYDRAETTRIRAAEGWITPTGLVNDELDISRSFGFFHLLPVVNARPDICIYDLTDQDEFVIIANRGLWDYVSYQAAVDIAQGTDPMTAAQKLRDFAISYGADGSTVIMVVSVSDLFKGPTTSSQVDRRRRPRIGIIDRTLNRLREEVPPPTGHVAIVFTDIRGSTHLWGASYTGMITAMNLHNDLLRRNLRFCGGYEVRTEGDSFMCSFSTALAAVWWCMKIQVELLEVPWPSEILDCPDGKPVYDEHGRLIARGLSVRMGIHCGAPLCQTDPVTQRMDYFGLIVTRSSRIASRASGGHILCSSDVMNELAAKIFENTEYSDSQPQEAVDGIRRLEPVIIPVGEVRLKGLEVPEVLSLLFPATLIGRKSIEDSTATKSTSRFELNIAEVRDLAMLCHRLEITTSQRVFRPTPTAEASDSPVLLHGDPSVFLPPTADITEADLLMLLYSLTIRIENVGRIMQSSTMPNSPTLDGKNELVSALKALDERTLDEIWAIVRRDN